MGEEDREPTEAEQAELDELLARRTTWLEAATAELQHQVALIKAQTAYREVAWLERMWRA